MNGMPERGAEILPDTWEYQWFASVVAKTEEFAGRPSHWNRKLYDQPGAIAGVIEADGSMTISREHVLDPARPGYTEGRSLTHDERYAAGGATRMAVFRARASLSGLGDDTGPGVSPIGSLEDIALESALADRFTGTYGGRIAESLTEQDLPVDSFPAFPAYTTATDRLMYSLSRPTDLGPGELRDLLESTDRSQRFNVIADRVIDTQLGDRVPESHRDQLRQDLTGSLRRGLSGLTMAECSQLTHQGSKLTWGHDAAELTEIEFDVNLEDIKAHYDSWDAEHPGVKPPELPDSLRETFLDREEDMRQIWAERGWPAQQPVAGREQEYYEGLREQIYPNEREQEIAQLQQFLWSHTAPSRHTDSATGAGERPNNVHDIGSTRKGQRGIE
ncbi:hypothetical protein ACQPYH_39015 [Kribbella sp. CA-245084]|uniref:hypothetical protein n=1 Tax=Kribbella sp. CA-245084 TaxID=3239940 RepID=UPI003D8B0DC4